MNFFKKSKNKKIDRYMISWDIGFLKDADGWYEDENNIKYHFKEGYLHNDNDEPAITYKGQKEWHFEGKLHRLNKPAVISESGIEEWYYFGLLHRLDGPAYTDTKNSLNKFYILNNMIDEEIYQNLPRINNKIHCEQPLEINDNLIYILEGELYSEEEFDVYISKKSLEENINTIEKNTKRKITI